MQSAVVHLLRAFPVRVLRRPLFFAHTSQTQDMPDRTVEVAWSKDGRIEFGNLVPFTHIADHAGHVTAFCDALLADVVAAAVRGGTKSPAAPIGKSPLEFGRIFGKQHDRELAFQV